MINKINPVLRSAAPTQMRNMTETARRWNLGLASDASDAMVEMVSKMSKKTPERVMKKLNQAVSLSENDFAMRFDIAKAQVLEGTRLLPQDFTNRLKVLAKTAHDKFRRNTTWGKNWPLDMNDTSFAQAIDANLNNSIRRALGAPSSTPVRLIEHYDYLNAINIEAQKVLGLPADASPEMIKHARNAYNGVILRQKLGLAANATRAEVKEAMARANAQLRESKISEFGEYIF